MANPKQDKVLSEQIAHRISLFFYDVVYTRFMIDELLEDGNIFFKPEDILPYLQTALIDEKILEVELDGEPQVYFSKIHDDTPDPLQKYEDQPQRLGYTPGDYLKEMTSLVTLPLEPGMGNYSIRYSTRVLIRFFTTGYGVELGTFFQDISEVDGIPVLQLDYPVIGRIVRGSREYRAKVPDSMDLKMKVVGKRGDSTFLTTLYNISTRGLAFSIQKDQQKHFILDESRALEILIDNITVLKLNGKVRHLSKIRGKWGTEFMCGIEADLVTREIANRLEKVVATVQRAHLRELSEKAIKSGLNLIK